jgi:hypothetical protein
MRSWWILLVLTLPATGWSQADPAAKQVSATDDDPRLPWRSARWACLAGGAVALALGGLSFAEGMGDESAIEDATRDPDGVVTGLNQREALRMQDSATRFKTMGAVGMGVGGALLATGIVLWVLEPDAPKRAAPTQPEPEVRPFSVIPLLQPGQAGVGLSARF